MPLFTRVLVIALSLALSPTAFSAQRNDATAVAGSKHSLMQTQFQRDGAPQPLKRAALQVSTESSPSVWPMVLIMIALVGHQLHRRHRLLRPHRITT